MPPAARLHPVALLILLAAVLVAPASAVTIVNLPDSVTTAYDEWTRQIDFNAYDPAGAVIGELLITLNPDTTAEFTLYDYGGTVTGEINRTSTGPTSEIVTYRLGNQTAGPYEQSTWLGIGSLGSQTYIIQYGVYDDGGRHLWMKQPAGKYSWTPLSSAITDIIYRVSVTSTQETRVAVSTVPIEDMNAAISERVEGTPGNLLALLWGLMEGVYLVISLGWYVFKTVFIDNLLLFFGLFEAVGLAYAANKSRDIFQFYRRIVDYNAKVFRAMVWLIEKMVTIITRIIDALNPIG